MIGEGKNRAILFSKVLILLRKRRAKQIKTKTVLGNPNGEKRTRRLHIGLGGNEIIYGFI